ncbi:hypothetical protein [Streptomyces canus]|uniref:hypothetical protein n=1 Tax=Streptomyces canus TaxID=58343 RepID=UPI00225C0F64|nr:hypothetical protein [Streptomyces canus]MCX4853779.1 hypothetical protein [Streptomyces canus]
MVFSRRTMDGVTIEVYADRFLQCVFDAMGDDPEQILYAGTIVEAARLDAADEQTVVSHLVVRGWAKREKQADGRSLLFRLTRTGVAKARELRAQSESRAEREAHLNNVLPRWAYNNSPSGGSADLQMFAAAKEWWFCGTQVTWDEVDAAVGYLAARDLLVADRVSRPQRITLTADGIDFVRSKQTLWFFLTTRQQRPVSNSPIIVDSNVVYGPVYDSSLAAGGSNAQTVRGNVTDHSQHHPQVPQPNINVGDIGAGAAVSFGSGPASAASRGGSAIAGSHNQQNTGLEHADLITILDRLREDLGEYPGGNALIDELQAQAASEEDTPELRSSMWRFRIEPFATRFGIVGSLASIVSLLLG